MMQFFFEENPIKREEFISKIRHFLPYDHKIEISGSPLITVKKNLFETKINLNQIFLKADDNIIGDIINFIKGNDRSKELKKRLADFYKANKASRNINLVHKSKVMNLKMSFDEVLEKINILFPGIDTSCLNITWGKNTKKRTKSVRFGSFDFTRNLIRIHPVCDNKEIPRHFFNSIIYHEAAHFVYHKLYGNTGSYHNRKFYAVLKSLDKDFDKSYIWEKKNKNLFFNIL